jgi:hypothetical protein
MAQYQAIGYKSTLSSFRGARSIKTNTKLTCMGISKLLLCSQQKRWALYFPVISILDSHIELRFALSNLAS